MDFVDTNLLDSPTSWVELSRANLLHNLAGIRALVGGVKIMAVVKANAYGAGAVGMARVLAGAGVDAFGVATVAEGVELRQGGIAGTIVCLAYFTRQEIPVIFEYDLTPSVFTLPAARLLDERAAERGRVLPVWVKVDTGLGRLGVPFDAAAAFLREIGARSKPEAGLRVAGIFSTLTENPDRDPIQTKRLLAVRWMCVELARSETGQSEGVELARSETGQSEGVELARSETGQSEEVELARSETGQSEGVELARSETGQSEGVELARSETGQSEGQRLSAVREAWAELARSETGQSQVVLSLASSNGILSLPAGYLDVVRPGIVLHGLEPSDRSRMDMRLVARADLRPIATWKARVAHVKLHAAGEQIGYGSRPRLDHALATATLAVGWADGYPPAMANGGVVLVQGRPCPVLAVSANSTIIDLSNAPGAGANDEVVLMGRHGSAELTAAEMARQTGAGIYRLLSAIPVSVPRIWV